MNEQIILVAQAVIIGQRINRQAGRCCTVAVGGPLHDISVLVLSEGGIEPLYSRTAHLAREDDSELTVSRAARSLAEVVQQLQLIASTGTPRGQHEPHR